MSTKFLQQLLGTVLLVVLAIVLLPSLLTGKKHIYQHSHTTIALQGKVDKQPTSLEQQQMINQLLPKQPPVGADKLMAQQQKAVSVPPAAQQHSNQPLQVAPPVIAAPNSAVKAKVPPAATPLTAKSSKANNKPANSASKTAYAIQLVALKNPQQVERLVAKLRLSGYEAYTVKSGSLTRIFVGPFANRASAEQRLPALHKLTGLRGIIRIK